MEHVPIVMKMGYTNVPHIVFFACLFCLGYVQTLLHGIFMLAAGLFTHALFIYFLYASYVW